MAEEQEDPKGSPEGEQKRKRKLIFIIAAAVLAVLGVGGGAFYFMSGGGEEQQMAAKVNPEEHDGAAPTEEGAEGASAEAAAKKAATEGTQVAAESAPAAEKKEPESGFGETYPMKTFHLNLGNPLENHYIRVDVSLEFRGGEAQRAEIERRLPQLRDAIVGVISRQTRDMILDPDGKAQLRREMLIRVNRYMKQPIEAVYITDILIE